MRFKIPASLLANGSFANKGQPLTINLELASDSCLPCLVAGHTLVDPSVFWEGLEDGEAVYAVGRGLHVEVLGRFYHLIVPVPCHHRRWGEKPGQP